MLPSKISEPFGISQSICTRTLRNLTRYLHRNPLEPHQASSPPKPSGTSQGLCTGTFRNLTKHLLRQNLPEPHKVSHRNPVSAPEPSGTAQNPPEPQQVSSPDPSGTLLTLQTCRLHWYWPIRIFQYQYWRPAQQSRWPLQMGWRLRAREILSALRGRPGGFQVIWGWWIRSSPQDSACPTWSQGFWDVLGAAQHEISDAVWKL